MKDSTSQFESAKQRMEDEISVLKSKVEANLKDIDNMNLNKNGLDKVIKDLNLDLHN